MIADVSYAARAFAARVADRNPSTGSGLPRASSRGKGPPRIWACAVVLLVAFSAACATRTPPPLPTALKYPDFVFPTVPAAMAPASSAAIDRGWRFLQNDDLRNAEREFAEALEQAPGLFPAQTALGYVALARGDEERALQAFAEALRTSSAYVPALVGQGQAFLAAGKESEALAPFEAALAADASLTDVRRQVEVLRFRNVQEVIERGRAAAAGGRLEEARTAYRSAIQASPDSPFLHRELGAVERKLGANPAALEAFRRAVALDPEDAASLVQIGELLEQQQDFAGAEAAYRKAIDIAPSEDLTRRIAVLGERAREALLPAEFRAIGSADRIARGELAALIGIRLDDVIRSAPPREVVMTDVRGHWAESWITQVARAGVLEPFPNHTFQPWTQVRRADLATAVSRLIALMASSNPSLRLHLTARPAIADMPAGHLNYPAASVAVASGVMPLLDGNRFQVARNVTGAEAVAVIDRLRALAAASR
jgi:tetratricopeptide (TPR) repeat protein